MNPTYWNQDPYTEKTFSKPFVPHSYSYRDYQMAWFNVIWYQNYEYSWFIQFFQNAHKIHYPFWFIKGWKILGSTKDIFPVHTRILPLLYSKYIQNSLDQRVENLRY